MFWCSSSLDIAEPKRSGKFKFREGIVVDEPLSACVLFEKCADWGRDEACSLPFAELERDRDERLDPEKKEAKVAREERDGSAPTLDSLFELTSGCFLVRRREILLRGPRFDSASSSCLKRFSRSFLSASKRFVTRFSLLFTALLSDDGETRVSGRLLVFLTDRSRDCCDPGYARSTRATVLFVASSTGSLGSTAECEPCGESLMSSFSLPFCAVMSNS